MIDRNLINYIRQNLNKGFDIPSIQNALVNKGYPFRNVYDTINYVIRTKSSAPQAPPPQKSSKKIWLFIGILAGAIIVGLLLFLFMDLSSKTISENEFSQGTSFELKENKEIAFMFDEDKHTITVDSVNDDSVDLIIQSNPIQVNIVVGEEKKFDLDNDGFYDIKIKLNSIKKEVPRLYIKKIHESICTENWNCGDWSSCSEQGSQSRICTDLNYCGTTKNKPSTTQSCIYVETCVENWDCTDWSSCVNGELTRTCTDLNNCNSEENKPFTKLACSDIPQSTSLPECENFLDQEEKDECYMYNAEDISTCEEIETPRYKNWCYINVAELKRDLSICDLILDQEEKDECYSNVGIAQDDTSTCGMINDNGWKNDCYHFIALNNQDITICDMIDDNDKKELCYAYVGREKSDTSICDQIQNPDYRNFCYGTN